MSWSRDQHGMGSNNKKILDINTEKASSLITVTNRHTTLPMQQHNYEPTRWNTFKEMEYVNMKKYR